MSHDKQKKATHSTHALSNMCRCPILLWTIHNSQFCTDWQGDISIITFLRRQHQDMCFKDILMWLPRGNQQPNYQIKQQTINQNKTHPQNLSKPSPFACPLSPIFFPYIYSFLNLFTSSSQFLPLLPHALNFISSSSTPTKIISKTQHTGHTKQNQNKNKKKRAFFPSSQPFSFSSTKQNTNQRRKNWHTHTQRERESERKKNKK